MKQYSPELQVLRLMELCLWRVEFQRVVKHTRSEDCAYYYSSNSIHPRPSARIQRGFSIAQQKQNKIEYIKDKAMNTTRYKNKSHKI